MQRSEVSLLELLSFDYDVGCGGRLAIQTFGHQLAGYNSHDITLVGLQPIASVSTPKCGFKGIHHHT